eukprot:SAG31_NODE_680_length_12881_cov_35.655453_4_plen_179_part_00
MEPAVSRVVPPFLLLACTHGAVPHVAVPRYSCLQPAQRSNLQVFGAKAGSGPGHTALNRAISMAWLAWRSRIGATQSEPAARLNSAQSPTCATKRRVAGRRWRHRAGAMRTGWAVRAILCERSRRRHFLRPRGGLERRGGWIWADFGLQDEGGPAARQRGGRSLSARTDLRPMGWVSG